MKLNKLIVVLIFGIFLVNSAYAHGESTFAEAEEIIEQKISCNELTEDQLEILGDYYMEQMHPGELHEIMDERMGGEGSESLRQVHINMGLSFYCGQHGAMSYGMMNTMMGRGMMSGSYGSSYMCSRMGGIWCYWPSWLGVFGFLFMALIVVALALLIIWLLKKLQREGKK